MGNFDCSRRDTRFEMTLTLPEESAPEALFARVFLGSSDDDPLEAWAGFPTSVFDLRADQRTVVLEVNRRCAGVDVDELIHLRVQFCSLSTCTEGIASEVLYSIDDALWRGEVSRLERVIRGHPHLDSVPRDCRGRFAGEYPVWECAIDRCQVGACVAGTAVSYCDGDVHFCEP